MSQFGITTLLRSLKNALRMITEQSSKVFVKNDFIETEPDLLNSFADILAKFGLGKRDMIADLTKCFF